MEFKETFELDYADLQACSLFKATSDVRFYLMGVYVGGGIIAATNGHCCLICNVPEVDGLDLIIPAESINSLIRKVGKKPRIKTVLLHKLDDGYWLLDHVGSYELFKPIDGKFPNVKRVDIPKPEKYPDAGFPQFNFDYLRDFQKAADAYLGRGAMPKLFPTSLNGVCYVEINDRVHGLIMPLKG